jgi:hypothetical protein
MIAIGILRGLSWAIAEPAVGQREPRQPTNRRPDKSTAVGRGACGWLYWVFSAALEMTLPSVSPEMPMISTIREPAPVPGAWKVAQ